MIKILMPISKDIEKKILWLRYKKRSWKDASQCEVDFYINSTIDISKELEKEGHNVSSVEVRKVIEKKSQKNFMRGSGLQFNINTEEFLNLFVKTFFCA